MISCTKKLTETIVRYSLKNKPLFLFLLAPNPYHSESDSYRREVSPVPFSTDLYGFTDEIPFWSSVNFTDIHEGKKELKFDPTFKFIRVPQVNGKYKMTVEPVINFVNKDDLVPHDQHQLDRPFTVVLDGSNTLTNLTATV